MIVSPGAAASTAAWIDCPGATLDTAAGAVAGIHPRAKPRTDTALMLSLACLTFILSCALGSVLAVELSISGDRVGDRGSRAIVNAGFTPARVTAGKQHFSGTAVDLSLLALHTATSSAACAVCVPASSARGVALSLHFRERSERDVSPHETVGHYFPCASGRCRVACPSRSLVLAACDGFLLAVMSAPGRASGRSTPGTTVVVGMVAGYCALSTCSRRPGMTTYSAGRS